jgi:hypothetical protein
MRLLVRAGNERAAAVGSTMRFMVSGRLLAQYLLDAHDCLVGSLLGRDTVSGNAMDGKRRASAAAPHPLAFELWRRLPYASSQSTLAQKLTLSGQMSA